MMASRRSACSRVMVLTDDSLSTHLPTSFNVATYELSALRTGSSASVAGLVRADSATRTTMG